MRKLFKKYPVLCISALCALISMIFVLPDAQYADYIDLQVICLLFSLMAVIQGFQSLGIFNRLAGVMLKKIRTLRGLYLILVYLPFFTSMLVTNDVALITFVPFALFMLKLSGGDKYKIQVIVLQTIAANIGSMFTPIGNPQNLYLYTNYHLEFGYFMSVTLIPVVLSGILLFFGQYLLPKQTIEVQTPQSEPFASCKMALYTLLFISCLLTVLHVLPYGIPTALVVIGLLFTDRKLLTKVDYALLLTFVCFFIFSGNLARLSWVESLLRPLLETQPILVSALTSQVISNVPAAILLSPFTDNAKGLLLGTNIGGLGTIIASLASVISFQFYSKEADAQVGRYMGYFTVLNFALFAILMLLSYII
ncbi:MAG: citrate transporter [Firmicutes bacterium]|nr:citrate transporter [Bacillota bacterium]